METYKAVSPVTSSDGIALGIAVFGERGYHPAEKWGTFSTQEDAQKKADELNTIFGINKDQAELIIVSTMFPNHTVTFEQIRQAGGN